MADTGIREKVVGVGKEGTRLTLTAATRWLAPESGSEFQMTRALLEDNATRDIKEKFPSVLGRKFASGSIVNLPVEQNNDFALLVDSVMGKNAGAGSVQTDAYVHVFTPATVLIPDTLSFVVDRGGVIADKGYNGCLVKKLSLSQEADERLMCNAEIIGLNEAAGTIGSATFADPNPFKFSDVSSIAIGGASNGANVTAWSMEIDNQAKLKNVLDGNETSSDIICVDGIVVTGTFQIYFVDSTERDKFVAGSTSDIVITYIGDKISTDSYRLIIDAHKLQYNAYPWGDMNGMFGASVSFNGYYSTGDTQTLTITIWNTQSAAY